MRIVNYDVFIAQSRDESGAIMAVVRSGSHEAVFDSVSEVFISDT